MDRGEQLKQLNNAFAHFVEVINSLSPEDFLRSLGDWTPRDIVAHLIGWNRNIRIGCGQIRRGLAPFYHKDSPNDYRAINAVSIGLYKSTDRGVLLGELESSKDDLVAYVIELDAQDWLTDFGPQHYRGGAVTIARSIESLTADYVNHADEITRWQEGSMPGT